MKATLLILVSISSWSFALSPSETPDSVEVTVGNQNPAVTLAVKPEKNMAESTTKKIGETWQKIYEKVLQFRHPQNEDIRVPEKAALRFFKFLSSTKGNSFKTRAYNSERPVEVRNLNYGVIIDYTAPSTRRRMFYINLETGDTRAFYVAHGKGSVPSLRQKSTFAQTQYFSNTMDSKASSLGFFVSGGTYHGKHGLSLQMYGIENSNSNAFDRAIVIHGAQYVGEDPLKVNNNQYLGLSWGCPAMGKGAAAKVIPTIANGALILGYHEDFMATAEQKPFLLEPPPILSRILKKMGMTEAAAKAEMAAIEHDANILVEGEDTENETKK